MTELTTTVQCDCGQKLRVVLKSKHKVTNPHGLTLDYANEPNYKLIVTDGKIVLNKLGSVAEYKFVCNKCLGGEE